MPVDAYIDFDSDESTSNTYPRAYVDPWDLENYAYIREHLDSLELSSEQSSVGEPVEASFDYTPFDKTKDYVEAENRKFYSFLDSQYGAPKYAEIDDIYGFETLLERNRQAGATERDVEDVYEFGNFGNERDDEEKHFLPSNDASLTTTSFESFKHKPVPVKRRLSYSYGDYGYGYLNSTSSLYSRIEDTRRSESGKSSHGRNQFKPNNFGLSSYGHLKIDYSCSWNNLDKYIYN